VAHGRCGVVVLASMSTSVCVHKPCLLTCVISSYRHPHAAQPCVCASSTGLWWCRLRRALQWETVLRMRLHTGMAVWVLCRPLLLCCLQEHPLCPSDRCACVHGYLLVLAQLVWSGSCYGVDTGTRAPLIPVCECGRRCATGSAVHGHRGGPATRSPGDRTRDD
jgi:hypothetical protein